MFDLKTTFCAIWLVFKNYIKKPLTLQSLKGLAFGSSAIEEAHQSEEVDCAGIEVFSMVEAIHELTGALIPY